MMDRYQVFAGSITAHCCFKATVIDTTKPDMIGGEQYIDDDGRPHFEPVCECFDMEDAEKVCAALNACVGPERWR